MFWAVNQPKTTTCIVARTLPMKTQFYSLTINFLPQHFCYTLDEIVCLPNRFGDVQTEFDTTR